MIHFSFVTKALLPLSMVLTLLAASQAHATISDRTSFSDPPHDKNGGSHFQFDASIGQSFDLPHSHHQKIGPHQKRCRAIAHGRHPACNLGDGSGSGDGNSGSGDSGSGGQGDSGNQGSGGNIGGNGNQDTGNGTEGAGGGSGGTGDQADGTYGAGGGNQGTGDNDNGGNEGSGGNGSGGDQGSSGTGADLNFGDNTGGDQYSGDGGTGDGWGGDTGGGFNVPTPTATNPVPEPITFSLFGAGLAGAVALRRRKTNTA
jgi:hypothetical protein